MNVLSWTGAIALIAGGTVLPMWAAEAWVRRRPGVARAGVVVGSAIAILAVDLWAQRVDLWDAVLLSVCLALGAALAWVPRATIGRLVVGVALGAVVAESVGRVVLPPAPGLYEEFDALPWFEGHARLAEAACALMAPEDAAPRPTSDERPVVLHVGDSLLSFPPEAPALEPTNRFPGLVGVRDAARRHVALAMPGSGYDAYLLAIRAALSRSAVREVDLYVYLGNDLQELGRQYPCCASRSLLDLSDPALPDQCQPWKPSPPAGSIEGFVLRSKAPMVVRALYPSSTVFAHLRYQAVRAAQFGTPWTTEPAAADDTLTSTELATRLDTTARILSVLRDELTTRRVRLALVLLPVAAALESPDVDYAAQIRTRLAQFAQLGDTLDIDVIDATSPFAGGGYDRTMFAADQVHLSDAGHAALADWLAPRLIDQSSSSSRSSSEASTTDRATP